MASHPKTLEKKKFEFPHVFVILFILIIMVIILSYFAPAGVYDRIEVDGRTMIDIDSFRYVENAPLSFREIITLIPNSMVSSGSVIVMLIFSCAGIEIILDTKAFDSALHQFVIRNRGREKAIICLVAIVYGLAGVLLSWTYGWVPFIPVTVAIAKSMGYDAVFGAGMILLPAASGWSSGVINVYTTAVAQSYAGLPTFSGLGYRIMGFVVFMIMTIAFLLWQAPKHKTVEADNTAVEAQHNAELELTTMRKVVCIWFLIGFAFLVYATVGLGWGNPEIGGILMFIGIIGGLIYGYSPNKICALFIRGTKGIMAGALTVGVAAAIMSVMEQTMLLDSLVHFLGEVLAMGGPVVGIVLMCLVVTVSDVFVSSANGKVVTLIPIMVPLSDILGIRRQAIVLAYCYGDGFTNWFSPTAGVIVASLGAAQVEWSQWIKFSWIMYLAYTVVSCILCAIAQIIGLGPF